MVLRSFALGFVLMVATVTTATAQSAPQAALVEKAQAAAAGAEQRHAALIAQRARLTARYQQQLAQVDGLKKQKRSWRRDRELNAAQASANDTATQLTALDVQLAAAHRGVLASRAQLIGAIDAELVAGAVAERAEQLARLRAQLVPQAATKKIVIPDAEIDPLADAEELEHQAAAIAAAEKQLEAQRKSLDKQHEELQLVAELRGAHDRASELSLRDDDQPHRGAPRGTGGGTRETAAGDHAPPQPDSAGGAGNGSGGGGQEDPAGGQTFGSDKLVSGFEATAAVALGEVIDRSTIDGMLRAQRSGDPKQRAQAAAQARDAVARRLELLKKKRAIIELRARKLRGR